MSCFFFLVIFGLGDSGQTKGIPVMKIIVTNPDKVEQQINSRRNLEQCELTQPLNSCSIAYDTDGSSCVTGHSSVPSSIRCEEDATS